MYKLTIYFEMFNFVNIHNLHKWIFTSFFYISNQSTKIKICIFIFSARRMGVDAGSVSSIMRQSSYALRREASLRSQVSY